MRVKLSLGGRSAFWLLGSLPAFQSAALLRSRCWAVILFPWASRTSSCFSCLCAKLNKRVVGSFTLYMEGNLFRLPGTDADAIGKDVVKAPVLPPDSTEDDVLALAWDQLRTCYDPEIPINIVDLGLIYECSVSSIGDGQRQINVRLTLTAPGCGMGDVLVQDIRQKLEIIPTVGAANVELVFDPPWNQSMMSEAARLQTGMF